MGYAATGFLSDTDATDQLGTGLAALLQPGDVVLLEGQIGAGKSHLARTIIQSMCYAAGLPPVDVPSPTYTLVQTYNLPNATVWHADLYRLSDASEVPELGLEDAIGTDILLIEWPDRLDEMPSGALTVELTVEGEGRRVKLSSQAERWSKISQLFQAHDA